MCGRGGGSATTIGVDGAICLRDIMRHIPGLDAIRLVCAVIVALGHYPLALRSSLTVLGPFGDLIGSAIGIAFNGPAAVIVFFVLSGFVIHRPYAIGMTFEASEYFTRRYLRIIPPTLIAIGVYLVAGIGPRTGNWNDTVLWSVFCELAYYTLYPVILRSGFRVGPLALASYGLTLAVAFASPSIATPGSNYTAFGYGTWLIGLPCWLSGAWVAEQTGGHTAVSRGEILTWRGGLFALAVLLRACKFHGTWLGPLSASTIHLTLFAPVIALWVRREAVYLGERTGAVGQPVLDRIGRSSFSLYLIHPVALVLALHLCPNRPLICFLVYLALLALATFGFYTLVERPSHRLAQRLGRFASRERRTA
ncbi:MAG: acyltransferase [Zymomonas sp.]|nr:MAG: acyltransferase [Zymomonas sp.]